MPESAKEGDSVLPEGSDIGLGSRDRAFESPHSDQNPLKSLISEGFSYSLSIAAQNLRSVAMAKNVIIRCFLVICSAMYYN